MPLAREKYNGESGTLSPTQSSHERPYVVGPGPGETEPTLAAALTAVIAVAPATIISPDGKTLVQTGFRYDPIHETGTDKGWYDIAVVYGSQEDSLQPRNTTRIEVDTTGGTVKIFQSLETLQVKKAGGTETATFFKGSIGNDGENVEGVDIVVPVFKFTVTKVFDPAAAPSLSTIYSLTGTVNDAQITFIDSVTGITVTLAAGENLFLGGRVGAARSDGDIEIVFSFEGSPNASNLTIGDITGVSKGGWNYLWTRYSKDVVGTGTGKVLISKPTHAVVERVYYSGNHSLLNI